MKTLVMVLAAVGLSGCAVYPAPYYETTYDPAPSYVGPPVYLQGSLYWFDYPDVYPRGYNRIGPRVFPHHGLRDGIRWGHGVRGGNEVRERDGHSNRRDRLPEPQRRHDAGPR